jgi:hypothetical protein
MLAPEAQATTIAFSVPRSGFGVNAGKSIGSIRFLEEFLQFCAL